MIETLLEKDADQILAQCFAHDAVAGNNYLSFLPMFYSGRRSTLFLFLESVSLVSTTQDHALIDAIAFLLVHKGDHSRWLGDLAAFFPAKPDCFVLGHTLQISWISPLVRLDLGIVIELPGPSSIVILGSLKVMIGVDETLALLYLRMDILGVIDFEKELISLDAQLVASHALGIFRLSGGMAFRLSWGSSPYILLSVGGFHPRFDPGPLVLPRLARVGASLDASFLAKVYLRLEMYVAFTSNTLQAGAKVEAGMELGPLQAEGHFYFDALIQFRPFLFDAEFSAGFSVEVFGASFASIDISGRISGPGPVVVHARGSVKRLFIKVSGSATFELGEHNADAIATVPSVVKAIEPELSKRENLRAEGEDATVFLKPDLPAVDGALVSPKGSMIWEQKRVPLQTIIDRFEGAPLNGQHELRVEGPTGWSCSQESDWFSPGRFTNLDLQASQTLNNATFQELPSGLRIGLPADKRAPSEQNADVSLDLFKRPEPMSIRLTGLLAYMNSALTASFRERSVSPEFEPGPPKIAVKPETFAVHESDGAKLAEDQTPFQAFQMSRRKRAAWRHRAPSPWSRYEIHQLGTFRDLRSGAGWPPRGRASRWQIAAHPAEPEFRGDGHGRGVVSYRDGVRCGPHQGESHHPYGAGRARARCGNDEARAYRFSRRWICLGATRRSSRPATNCVRGSCCWWAPRRNWCWKATG
jgi:hypothetical protein